VTDPHAVHVETKSQWCVGCDLGQHVDQSALAVIERRVFGSGEWEPRRPDKSVHEKPKTVRYLRHIERLPLGIPYNQQIDYIKGLLQRGPLNGRATLVVDGTGVGVAAVDLMRERGLRPVAVTAHGGDAESHKGQNYRVSKSELVNGLYTGLATGELQIAADIPDAEALREEFLNYRRTVSESGRLRWGAASGKHDDLISAFALAAWWTGKRPAVNRMIKIAGF